METALGVWARLRESAAAPSSDTLNALLTACVECGQGERALALLRDAQALGARCFVRAACPACKPACMQASEIVPAGAGCVHHAPALHALHALQACMRSWCVVLLAS